MKQIDSCTGLNRDFYIDQYWSFSLAVYANRQVAQWCLGLQNQAGANVNILLLLWWLGEKEVSLNATQLNTLHETAIAFDEQMLKPLRELRKKAKTRCAASLYQEIKKVELALEKHQQEELLTQLLINKSELTESSMVHPLQSFSQEHITQNHPSHQACHGVTLQGRHNLAGYLGLIGLSGTASHAMLALLEKAIMVE